MVAGKPRSRSLLQSSRVYSKDEELGKRDDDFRPRRREVMAEQLNPLRWRRRRLFAALVVAALLFLFIRNIPTDLGPANLRIKDAYKPPQVPPQAAPKKPRPDAPPLATAAPANTVETMANTEPVGAPPRSMDFDVQELERRYFAGPIRFFRLAESLNPLTMFSRDNNLNRNILFAASSMKSLANLLPIACEMAVLQRNNVHFAVMSRIDLSLDDIKSINSIDEHCSLVKWHDARPDYAEYSNDLRHEAATAGGLSHIKDHMSPHAVIVDDEVVEDPTFSRAIRRRAKDLFITLIEVPSGAYDNFKIISRLDHSSLRSWHSPTIEIVVQAQGDSVGSLIRMLRSLINVEYRGLRLPKLTINLATSIQPALKTFLSKFRWPQRYEPATQQVDPVTIRHQVQAHQASAEHAALRFVESFYPASPDHHVLLLSPQVEISPQFLVYLHYTVLRYKYSAARARGTGELLGIALDIPSFHLDGKIFNEPKGVAEDETVFLYNAPSSSSMLVFGDKWSVFHSYLEHRIMATQQGIAVKREKVVPETQPAWVEYLLELMRARGWSVLYPNRGFAVVHNELAQVPEEFDKLLPPSTEPVSDLNEPFLTASTQPVLKEHKEEPLSDPKTPLHDMLPQHGQLDELTNLPFVSHEGKRIVWNDAQYAKAAYTFDFRKSIGGCTETEAKRPRLLQDDKADDLFCLPTVDMLFDTVAEELAAA